MSNKTTNIIAVCLLFFVFIIAVFSMRNDSVTMDEVAHLPSGYSYLTQKDMRLNPEHPPLIKDLSALPLLFIKEIKFPYEINAWKEDVNGQWAFGYNFLYEQGNPVDKMIFWGRIPMVLMLVLLGFYIFRWARELFGNKVALLSLFLFSFSPTFLAHGRLVTTDVGAAVGVFIASYYFLKFLKNSSPSASLREALWAEKKNLIIAGIALGIAQLLKFSLILLFPFFGILIFVWAVVQSSGFREFIKSFTHYLLSFILIIIVCFVVIWGVYQYHTWNYPPERQVSDTEHNLASFGFRNLANLVVWAADKPVLRPGAQYSLGVLMILQRASGGHTTYFLNEISNLGWKTYFPIVYAIKVPLAFHFLLIIALLYLACLIKKPFWSRPAARIYNWIKSHFSEFAMLLFIGIYWTTSLSSNLNIGVRHLLPVFPFTILLVSGTIMYWIKGPRRKLKTIFLILLLIWQSGTVILIYPHFLAYFNEIVGGPDRGYIYTVDSNLDWGQDLKRLKQWVDEKGIDKIYVDYFGGGRPEYYLKEKYAYWEGTKNPKELPSGSYLAISATPLQGGRGEAIPGLEGHVVGFYRWLDNYTPVTKIGYSIFVYYID